MNTLIRALKISTLLTLMLALITGILYPLLIYIVGALLMPHQTHGSLLYNQEGTLIGSTLIAQNFTQDRYFHPRPSAAGPQGFDAMNSNASNLGPLSKTYIDAVKARAARYRSLNTIPDAVPIPIDPLTTSGSGLDPHITLQNALLQANRIAKSRSLPINTVIQLIEQHLEEPLLGLYGSKRVNVLLLNLALDRSSPKY